MSVVDEDNNDALTARTVVEDNKLRRRPQDWRLACQALVQRSVLILTRPQVRLPNAEARLTAARQAALPVGPTAWPAAAIEEQDEDAEAATAGEED